MQIEQSFRKFKALAPLFPNGLPVDSIVVMAGDPGTGKTILCAQMLFEQPEEVKTLWFTTFSETQTRMVGHLSQFSFFENKKIGHQVVIVDLGSIFNKEQSFESVMNAITEEIKNWNADVVVVDSFKQLTEWAESSGASFKELSTLPVFLSGRESTTFLIGEYSQELSHSDYMTFAMADGVIKLTFEKEDVTRKRYIEAIKMRGSSFPAGIHSTKISNDGYHIFPQPVAGVVTESTTERVSTGVSGLDLMTHGGFLKGSMILVNAPPGTGKSVLGMHFLQEGIKNDEKVLLYCVEEERPQILRNAAAVGIDFILAEEKQLLFFASPTYYDISLEEIYYDLEKLLEDHKPTRILLDSITALVRFGSPERFQKFMLALYSLTKRLGITILCSAQSEELLNTTSASGVGVSSVVDSIVLLKFVEIEGEVRRAISVLKTRGGGHDKTLREFVINDNGFIIGSLFAGMEGIFTGSARKVGKSTAEKLHDELKQTLGPISEKVFEEFKRFDFSSDHIFSYIDDLIKNEVLKPEIAGEFKDRVRVILEA